MKYLIIFILWMLPTASWAQQKETFDLATYSVPKDWKNIGHGGKDATGYAVTNSQNGTYCQLSIYKSMNSMGNAQLDFETEWRDLVANPYKITVAPQMGPANMEDGWDAKSGVAPFDFKGGQSIAMLVTMSGYSKRMSIVILTNTQDYQPAIEGFLESVSLKKPEMGAQSAIDSVTSIFGTWKANASDQSSWRVNNGVMSTISRQYTFNENGTYSFISKAFDPLMDKILLGKENGIFQMSGNKLTVNPQKSVLEAWSKKDGTDRWGKLLTTQNIALETATYQFTKHYFSGVQVWSLVLQADKTTQRDGPFNGGAAFEHAWLYSPLSNSNPAIELPAGR